jgi:adenylosuccinate synthase
MKLNLLKNYYGIGGLSTEAEAEFLHYCALIRDSESFMVVDEIPSGFENLIFESSQGLLLDQHIGFFPHVTRSNTGTKNILEMGYKPDLFLITRAYQTRHGNGPMTNENLPHNIKENPKETNVLNKFQGEFRRSLLDLDLLQYGMEKDEFINTSVNKSLVVTCLDLVKDEYRYTVGGVIVSHRNEQSFLHGIATHLGIKTVHAVSSPTGVGETYNFCRKTLANSASCDIHINVGSMTYGYFIGKLLRLF